MNYKDPQNNLHALDSAEFEHLLPTGSVQITDGEAAEITASKIIPPTYKELRAAAYPSPNDYLDSMVKGDDSQLQAYKNACLAVKLKYPKPVQS